MLLLGLQTVQRTDGGFQFAIGTAAGDGGADLSFLHAFTGLGHVHLLAQALDPRLGFADVFAHVFGVGAKFVALLFLNIQLVGQGRNRFGHFQCQVFTAGVQRRDGFGFQILDLGVVLAYAVGGQFVFGHDGDQFATGVRQRAVGIADFLVEDAQGLLVRDRFADFIGAAAQCGEQLAPDGLSHWIFPVDYLKKCSKASLARCTLSTRVFTSVTTLVRLESALRAPNML
ncbi:hypothetical protein D3C81_1557610 [compost metagenome]